MVDKNVYLEKEYQLKQLIDAVTMPVSGKTIDLLITSMKDMSLKQVR